ncbi:MAG: phage tail protein [Parasphingorhabdus sp.]|uniref:phage tail protein n=1 Tax=Parasphingorhabdus sp. TaxID=2709688 RepID=UPI003001C837
MATLVLTAVGTALGGPLGGAIGAFIGQQIDQNILFKPKGQEGPRLQELAVQTSSYGSQIPRIYGKMRVAGTVIWATDLQESKTSSGGGKGRPKTTTYSYSVSLAVALSSRNVKAIGRIWADGKILRGSAGDFKTQTGFRFYQGHEDQSVDGLLASAEADGGTPAYRGLALAIFEDMDLSDYGNRIPSLTFETIADDGSVSLGAIINDISGDAVAVNIDEQLHGFSASGQDRREALQAISDSFALSFTSSPDRIGVSWRQFSQDAVVMFLGDQIISDRNGKPVERPEAHILPETKVPRQYSLRYYDPDRDYQSGMQNAFRPGKSRAILHQDFPAAMAATQAKNIAQAKLWSIYQERSTAQLHIMRMAEPVKPGSFIRWDKSGDIWLVRSWEWNDGIIALTLSKAGDGLPKAEIPSDGGRPVKEQDALAGMTRLSLVDLPFALDAPMAVSSSAKVYAAAAGGQGWRNAQLFVTGSDGVSQELVGQISAPSTIGSAPEALGDSRPYIIDRKNKLLIQMHGDKLILNDADQAQLFAGNNLAAIGREVIQFGSAQPIGDNRYLISYLLRGLGGTEVEMGCHGAGEDFILLKTGDLTEIDSSYYIPFQPLAVAAMGRGDDMPVSRSIDVPGRALKPWSPVHPRYAFNPAGDLRISWTRRSRAGLIWADNVETPLAEESERYRISVNSQNLAESDIAVMIFSAAELQAYRADGISSLSCEIRQIGQHNISDPLPILIEI